MEFVNCVISGGLLSVINEGKPIVVPSIMQLHKFLKASSMIYRWIYGA